MKVCVFTLHPVDDRRVLMRGAQTLTRAGHSVHLIGTNADGDGAQTSRDPSLFVREVGPLRRRPLSRLALHWRIWKAVQDVPADVYHTHDPDLLPMLVWIRWRRRRSTVYDVHEFYGEQFSRKVPRHLRGVTKHMIEWLERRFARFAGNVVVVDPVMVDSFSHQRINVLLAPNHVLASAFPPSQADSQAEELVVASTGTISEARGSLVLADVCHAIDDRQLPVRVLVWERAFSAHELARFRERLGDIGPRVELLPSMSPTEVARELGRCHVGISTLQNALQYANAVPSKLFEYMAARLAIVASDLPATRRVLELVDGATLVEPADVAAYVDALEVLLADRERLEQARESARSACLEHFDWNSQVAPSYIEYFTQLAQHRK